MRSIVTLAFLVASIFLLAGGSPSASANRRPHTSVPLLSLGGIADCIDFDSSDSCTPSGDGDAYWDQLELETGSDPNNPNSTPEHGLFDEQFPPHDTCQDGVDNDLDGGTDHRDRGCRVTCRDFLPARSCKDRDHDGWIKYMELALGSDPGDGLSTPEALRPFSLAEPCSDGIDNDLDGSTDAADSGCPGISDCIDFDDSVDCAPF